jgi:hypothetical protein
MKHRYALLAAFAACAAGPAGAQEKTPTIEGAHEFIRQVVAKGAIEEVTAANHASSGGISTSDGFAMTNVSVVSEACLTTFYANQYQDWISVNWTTVAKVGGASGRSRDGSAVWITGGTGGWDGVYIALNSVEITGRFEKAAEFLRVQCDPAAETGF